MIGSDTASSAAITLTQPFARFADEEINQSIPARFEQQARLHGSRLAISTETESITYKALNATANRLARQILALRGGHSEPVALMFDHGAGALTAMLAVLKAGKFYLVLEPSFPRDKLGRLLADSGASIVIADNNNISQADGLHENVSDVVNFDELDEALPDENLGLKTPADSLAMLLYTSGSTGRPKGVMHSHQSVLVEVRNLTNAWGISSEDRLALQTSLSFAISVRIIYGALLNGSSAFMYDLKDKGFGDLGPWLRSSRITLFLAMSTTFRNFMTALPVGEFFPEMRVVACGGEPMTRTDIDLFNAHFRHPCVLGHGLGPTECFMICMNYFPHGSKVQQTKLTVGYTFPDKDVALLDENGVEVPAGEIGEICVRSRYIALGYWRDTERTNASFFPDPNGGAWRTYRTGDLGSRGNNGCLTHEGRRDFLTKIRGYRIDPLEVEEAIRAVPGVSGAIVVAREDAAGEKQLIAYFVPTKGIATTITKIRNELAQVLPDFMIPAAFVRIDALPYTPNGKLDRINLPQPSRDRPLLDVDFVAPTTKTEDKIAQIWRKVLDLDRVGIHDNILDLGAHSLNMTQILNRLRDEFRVELSLKALFDSPTIASLAATIESIAAPGTHEQRQLIS